MALSDGKILDAQAGAETFASALLAALAGVNSVSGPGMLDFLLVFSLAKLVFDDEVCGQTLHFVRDDGAARRPADRRDLIDQLMTDQHLIMAAAHARPLARRAVPAGRDDRARQPRELDEGRGAGHRTSGRPTRSTAGSPHTSRSRPTRPSTPSCAGSSGPVCATRRSCRSSRRRTEPTIVDDPIAGRRHNPETSPPPAPANQEDPPS